MAFEFVARNGVIALKDSVISGSLTVTGSSQITGSFNVSGSTIQIGNNTLIGNTNLTGSVIISGSTTQIGNNSLTGNTNLTGSINVSGSQTFVGNLALTGSFVVSGSTTQIGNNTLYGNTLLTGSIVISGSIPPGQLSASVNISGDTALTGFLRFNPYGTNIDTNISASYIYVSGSTQDLYFSQNTKGYSNTTRLRWLEGNLYTGLLSGGVISASLGSTSFSITSGSAIIVTLNASTASVDPYPTVKQVSWNTQTTPLLYSASAKITYIGIDNTGQIVQQTVPWGSIDVNQWDSQVEIGVVLHLSGSKVTGVYNAPQVSYGFAQQTDDFIRAFGPIKISGHTLQASGSAPTLSIIKTGGTAYNKGANYVNNANHPSTVIDPAFNISKIYRYYISGSTPVIDSGVGGAGYTEIDNKNYVDTTTGTLATVGASNWSIQRVFWIPNSPTNAFLVYYGNARYSTLVNAVNAKDSEAFTEAPNTAQNAIFLGYIIIQGGGSGTPPRDLNNSNETAIIPGGLFRSVGGVGSSGTAPVSNTLAGLSDVAISSPSVGDLLVYGTGTQWNNNKALSGSYSLTGSLSFLNGGVTGSLFGTASNAVSASYALSSSYAITASYAIQAATASYVQNAQTASYVLNAVSSSFATSASFATTSVTSSYSNAFTASNLLVNNTITATTLIVQTITSSQEYSSGSNVFGNSLSNTQVMTGSVTVTGSLSVNNFRAVDSSQTSSMSVATASYAVSSSYAFSASYAPDTTFPYTGSAIISGSLSATGSVSMTGSLNVNNALYVSGSSVGIGTNSPAFNLDLFGNTLNNPYIRLRTNASSSGQNYANGIIFDRTSGGATNNIGIYTDPSKGHTTNADALTFALINSPYTRLFTIQQNGGLVLGSYAGTNIAPSNGFIISGNVGIGTPTDAGFRLDVNGTARVQGNTTVTGSLSVSGSITTTGTITAQTLVVQVVSSSIEYASGSNIFGNLASNTQQFTGSVLVSGSITVSGSVINNLTSSFAISSSFATSASNAQTASYVNTLNQSLLLTGSFTTNADTLLLTGSLIVTGSTLLIGTVGITSASLDNQQILSTNSGSYQIVTSTVTGSYKAAFFDYVIFSGSATRAGTVVSTWSNTAIDYYENYTNDVSGSTSKVTLRVALTGSNVQLQATSSNAAWTIRSLIRLI